MNGAEESDCGLVRVGKNEVGLVGLNEIFEDLKSKGVKPSPALEEKLVERAGERNYIPAGAREDYKKGLLREYRKFLGERVEEEGGLLDITILGPGCPSCNQIEQEVMAVLSEMGIPAGVRHVTAPEALAQYGVFATPALILNGKVRSKGTLPSRSEIRKWLKEEMG